MRFDLSKYSTVSERLSKLHAEHADARIVTTLTDIKGDIGKTQWVVKAAIYLTADDQRDGIAKATGHAFEIDGTGGANNTSALENAETSAIGRALAIMDYSVNKESGSLASREEMEKVIRNTRDYAAEARALTDKDALRLLYAEARAAKASPDVLAKVKARATELDTDSKPR